MLSGIRVLRCLQVREEVKSVLLYTRFTDASQETYGAAVYVH